MTVKRKPDSDELEITGPAMWKLLAAKGGYRTVLIVLVLSMHPIGRQILGTFGLQFPDQREVTMAASETQQAKVVLSNLTTDVKEMKSGLTADIAGLKLDVANLKANSAIFNSKLDALDQTFTGFKIDFNKYRETKQ